VLIVGERINTSRKRIRQAVAGRDAAFIRAEARSQAAAGATHIDVNAGTDVSKEADDLKWLVETVQAEVDLPLCIDTASGAVLKGAIALCARTPLVNSITGEESRKREILPVVVDSGAHVVALTMDDAGLPEDLAGRLKVARSLVKELEASGVGQSRVHFDPLIRPISTNPEQAMMAAEAIRELRRLYPEAGSVCGLSNVSFGLPKRKLLNRAYLAMMVASGIRGVIIDPTEEGMMATLLAARALAGQDQYCMDYITAERDGRLGD
jgi:5-methyltetrahydrofolate--homocysteine methyltransferase